MCQYRKRGNIMATYTGLIIELIRLRRILKRNTQRLQTMYPGRGFTLVACKCDHIEHMIARIERELNDMPPPPLYTMNIHTGCIE